MRFAYADPPYPGQCMKRLFLAVLILVITQVAGATPVDTARPLAPSPTSPGLASTLAASRCGSADVTSRRSLREVPPLRAMSPSFCESDKGVSGAQDLANLRPVVADSLAGLSVLGCCGALRGLHVNTIYPSVDNVKSLVGMATWYCGRGSACTRGYSGDDLVAAIDPSLGIRKGTLLTVTHGGHSVLVRVVDTCACSGARLIDLTSGAFSRLAPLSRGVIRVTLTVGTRLPNTYTAP